MTTNNQNITKKAWALPSIIKIPSSQITSGNNGTLAVTLNNSAFLEPTNNPVFFKPTTKPVAATNAPTISLLRFAGYCVVLILMLPMLLVSAKRPAHKFD